ncbi:MAG: DUF1152 domain-containing protein [Gemmatales bacterium]
MNFLRLPFYDELEPASNILLAGAGGGFDIFSSLPLYFGLHAAGKKVHLANLSFSHLEGVNGPRLHPALLEINADSRVSPDYFPEYYLSRWFRQQGKEVPVYCFDRTGCQPIAEAYRTLVQHLQIDTVILVDGGTDSLMRGDEAGLGTPEEDMASIAAVDELADVRKYLMCLAFGVDSYHGVCHTHAFEAIADLTRQGAFLGALTLLQKMPEVQQYIQATESVFAAMPHHPSIVNASVLSALEGQFGDHHRTKRTQGSILWINPLMTIYWFFHLEPVARRVQYLPEIRKTQTYFDLVEAIEAFRGRCEKLRERSTIPDASFRKRR